MKNQYVRRVILQEFLSNVLNPHTLSKFQASFPEYIFNVKLFLTAPGIFWRVELFQ